MARSSCGTYTGNTPRSLAFLAPRGVSPPIRIRVISSMMTLAGVLSLLPRAAYLPGLNDSGRRRAERHTQSHALFVTSNAFSLILLTPLFTRASKRITVTSFLCGFHLPPWLEAYLPVSNTFTSH